MMFKVGEEVWVGGVGGLVVDVWITCKLKELELTGVGGDWMWACTGRTPADARSAFKCFWGRTGVATVRFRW